MGIFASNRTQLSEVTTGYDLNYTTESDAVSMIIESYTNDFAIFEALLKRDILASGDILTEAEEDGLLSKLWNGVLKIIDSIKEKINTIIDSVCSKIDEFKTSYYSKEVSKTEADYDKADLSEFTTNFPIFNYSEFEKCKDIKTVLKNIFELDINSLKGQPIEAITVKKNKEFAVYDNIKSSMHDSLWSKTKTNKPFKDQPDFKNQLKQLLKERATDNRTIKTTKNELFKYLETQKSAAKTMLKDAKKEKNIDKGAKEYNIAFARECIAIVNEAQRVSADFTKSLLGEYKKIISTSIKLYKSASSYAKKQLKESYIDIDYLIALGEADEYDFFIHVEDPNYNPIINMDLTI